MGELAARNDHLQSEYLNLYLSCLQIEESFRLLAEGTNRRYFEWLASVTGFPVWWGWLKAWVTALR